MKKTLTLLAILFLPAFIYIYFALGIPKVRRAPFFGPRTVVAVAGTDKVDTAYYSVPAFRCLTTGGLSFDSKEILDGRSYVAVFLPTDSIKTMLPILAEDLKSNKKSYGYARFVFFLPADSAGKLPPNAPDIGRDLKIGPDSAFTVFVDPELFEMMRMDYFVPDPARTKDPWQTTTDAILIDRLGRIRGYYNIRYAAEIRKMKEDVNHILLRDEGVQTLEESKVEQKHEDE